MRNNRILLSGQKSLRVLVVLLRLHLDKPRVAAVEGKALVINTYAVVFVKRVQFVFCSNV